LLTAFGASPPPAMRTLSSPCSVDEEPQSSSQKARTRHTPSPVQLYLQQLTPNSNRFVFHKSSRFSFSWELFNCFHFIFCFCFSADERLSFQPQNASAQLFYVFLENLLAAEQRRQATPQVLFLLIRFITFSIAFSFRVHCISRLQHCCYPSDS
jgi:hypothetical protein